MSSKPSDANVKKLMGMGYTKSKASKALKECSNNVQSATAYLVRKQREEDEKEEMKKRAAELTSITNNSRDDGGWTVACSEDKNEAEGQTKGSSNFTLSGPSVSGKVIPKKTKLSDLNAAGHKTTSSKKPVTGGGRVGVDIHPCVARYGKCKFGNDCMFKDAPADLCTNYVMGTCIYTSHCRNSHTIEGIDARDYYERRKNQVGSGGGDGVFFHQEVLLDAPSGSGDGTTKMLLNPASRMAGKLFVGETVELAGSGSSEMPPAHHAGQHTLQPIPDPSAWNGVESSKPTYSDPMMPTMRTEPPGGGPRGGNNNSEVAQLRRENQQQARHARQFPGLTAAGGGVDQDASSSVAVTADQDAVDAWHAMFEKHAARKAQQQQKSVEKQWGILEMDYEGPPSEGEEEEEEYEYLEFEDSDDEEDYDEYEDEEDEESPTPFLEKVKKKLAEQRAAQQLQAAEKHRRFLMGGAQTSAGPKRIRRVVLDAKGKIISYDGGKTFGHEKKTFRNQKRHPCIVQHGSCKFGEFCRHAHLPGDICVHWLNGGCRYDEATCRYKHRMPGTPYGADQEAPPQEGQHSMEEGQFPVDVLAEGEPEPDFSIYDHPAQMDIHEDEQGRGSLTGDGDGEVEEEEVDEDYRRDGQVFQEMMESQHADHEAQLALEDDDGGQNGLVPATDNYDATYTYEGKGEEESDSQGFQSTTAFASGHESRTVSAWMPTTSGQIGGGKKKPAGNNNNNRKSPPPPGAAAQTSINPRDLTSSAQTRGSGGSFWGSSVDAENHRKAGLTLQPAQSRPSTEKTYSLPGVGEKATGSTSTSTTLTSAAKPTLPPPAMNRVASGSKSGGNNKSSNSSAGSPTSPAATTTLGSPSLSEDERIEKEAKAFTAMREAFPQCPPTTLIHCLRLANYDRYKVAEFILAREGTLFMAAPSSPTEDVVKGRSPTAAETFFGADDADLVQQRLTVDKAEELDMETEFLKLILDEDAKKQKQLAEEERKTRLLVYGNEEDEYNPYVRSSTSNRNRGSSNPAPSSPGATSNRAKKDASRGSSSSGSKISAAVAAKESMKNVTFLTLTQLFPNINPDSIQGVLKRTNYDFNETFGIIQLSPENQLSTNIFNDWSTAGAVASANATARPGSGESDGSKSSPSSSSPSSPSAPLSLEEIVAKLQENDESPIITEMVALNGADKLQLDKLCEEFPSVPRNIVRKCYSVDCKKSSGMAFQVLRMLVDSRSGGDHSMGSGSSQQVPNKKKGQNKKPPLPQRRSPPPASSTAGGYVDNDLYNRVAAEMQQHSDWRRTREEAYLINDARKQLAQMATAAYNRGDGKTAKMLSKRQAELGLQYRKLNMLAMQSIEMEQNRDVDRRITSIDLHGFHVNEALEVLARRVKLCLQKRIPRLNVMIGKGLHSKDGVSKIFPSIVDAIKYGKQSSSQMQGNLSRCCEIKSRGEAELSLRIVMSEVWR